MLKTAALLLIGGATISFVFVYGGTSRELTEFITIPVEHGVLKETVTATGQVESLTVVEVGSQVSGRIAKVHVTYNDNVTEGQALAQIDRQSFAARVREAEADIEISLAAVEVQRAIVDKTLVEIEVAELEQQVFLAKVDEAQAILTIALAKLNRRKQLQRNGTVAFAEVEDDEGAVLTARARLREAEAVLASNKLRISATRADLVRAKAELNGALASIPLRRATLQAAEVELARSTIRSPTDGVIIDRNIEAGQTVAAALEAPVLFTIAGSLDQMVVHVNVDETDIGKTKAGQRAQFMVDAYPNRKFQGTVKEIRKSPNVFQNVVTYIVVLDTMNSEHFLFPGMTALVEITISESEPGLKVLGSAIGYQPSTVVETENVEAGAIVWKTEPGGALEPIAVELGPRDASHQIVYSERLHEGDQVVIGEVESSKNKSFLDSVLAK